ncbi:hypothetical protein SAMN05216603_10513 [Pseudomonas benzenivorans]|nr:hypothetical protein SAMN05216603_10513 [Pseudomonas benzenivorans]
MGLKRLCSRSPDAIREPSGANPRIASGLRRWLFWLCHSRAGQCLEHNNRP